MKNITIFILLLLNSFLFAQQETCEFFNKKIQTVEKDLKNIISDNKYIIYCTPYKLHLFLEKENEYYEFIYLDNNDKFELFDLKINKDSIINHVFDTNKYEKGYVDMYSKFYEDEPEIVNGLPTYFSFTIKNKKYSEYVLSVMFKPVPMDLEVYRYLSYKIIGLNNSQTD